MVKISRSRPPIALPSSLISSMLMSASCGAESLGLDPAGRVVHRDQQRGGRLHERRRAADEDRGRLVLWPRDLLDHRRVEPSRVAIPTGGLLASQRVVHGQSVTGGCEPVELLAV